MAADNYLELGRGWVINRSSHYRRIENVFEGLNVSRIQYGKRPFYSFEVDGIVNKYQAESLNAFWNNRRTDGGFFFYGNDWSYINSPVLVTHENSNSGLFLPNRHINPNSITVVVKDYTGTESVVSNFFIEEERGFLTLPTQPYSIEQVSVAYGNLYYVRFDDTVSIEESLNFNGAYTIKFRLIEKFETADASEFFASYFLQSSSGILWSLGVTASLDLITTRVSNTFANSIAITDDDNQDWVLSIDDDGVLYTNVHSSFLGTKYDYLTFRKFYALDVDSGGILTLNTIA